MTATSFAMSSLCACHASAVCLPLSLVNLDLDLALLSMTTRRRKTAKIKNKKLKNSYTRAYINHLGRAGELLGGMLVSQHNVFFMNELMASIRRAIRAGKLDEEEEKWLAPGLRSRDYHRRAAEQKEATAAGEGSGGEAAL